MSDQPHAAGQPARSPHWAAVRSVHLHHEPACAACGTREHLEVHHIHPFHLHPEAELDPTNLVTLCQSPTHNCHLIWGHLLSFASWNADVLADAAAYRKKLAARPEAPAT